MKISKIFIFLTVFLLGLIFAGRLTYAATTPDFPSCSNPQGSLKVSYPDGVHGIPGSGSTYTGSDSVYTVSPSALTQCFCSIEGAGIQTNWWKIGSLSQEDIDYLKNLGWVYIPDGSIWGLEAASYMAFNSNYNCAATINPTSVGGFSMPGASECTAQRPSAPNITSVVRSGMTALVSWTAVPLANHYTIAYGVDPNNLIYGVFDTGNVTSYTVGSLDPGTRYYFVVYAVNDCMPSLASSTNPGVGGVGGNVLGLASTGNIITVYAFAGLGLAFLLAGIYLQKKQPRS
jgi:hypothetical protein